MTCSCKQKSVEEGAITELDEDNPVYINFKKNLKNLASSVAEFKKTQDGKTIPEKYWSGIEELLKKSKLGIAMIELGIDLDDDNVDDSELKITPMGDTRDGDEQFDKKEEEEEKEREEEEKEKAEKEKEETDAVKEQSQSKSQQRLFGMVHAYNSGELKKSEIDDDLFDKIKKIASGMKQKDVKKLAKTKHTDLPEKVPTDEINDIVNHLTILLNETNLLNLEKPNISDTGFELNSNFKNDNYNLTFENTKFYLKSDDYIFELGGIHDLNEVVERFVSLINNSNENLIKDYNLSLT